MQSSTLLTFMYCVGSSPGSIPITLCTGQHVSLTVLLFTIYFGIYLCSNTSQLNLLQQVLYSNIKHMSLKLVTKESIFSHSLGSNLVCNNPYRSRHTLFLSGPLLVVGGGAIVRPTNFSLVHFQWVSSSAFWQSCYLSLLPDLCHSKITNEGLAKVTSYLNNAVKINMHVWEACSAYHYIQWFDVSP